MRAVVFLVCLGATVVGCGTEAPEPSGRAPVSAPQSVADARPAELDMGDIETNVFIEMRLDAASAPDGVSTQELVDRRYRITLQTVSAPLSAPVPLAFDVQIGARENLSETPLVMRLALVREWADSETERREVVIERNMLLPAEGLYQMTDAPFDVLAGLEALPESMLAYIQAELLLMPKGTDPAEVDPETAEVSEERQGVLRSNPVRINFAQAEEEGDLDVPFSVLPMTGLSE